MSGTKECGGRSNFSFVFQTFDRARNTLPTIHIRLFVHTICVNSNLFMNFICRCCWTVKGCHGRFLLYVSPASSDCVINLLGDRWGYPLRYLLPTDQKEKIVWFSILFLFVVRKATTPPKHVIFLLLRFCLLRLRWWWSRSFFGAVQVGESTDHAVSYCTVCVWCSQPAGSTNFYHFSGGRNPASAHTCPRCRGTDY